MFSILYKASRRSRIINKIFSLIYKCEIPVSAKIGKNVTFNHNGLGVVIHPNAVIEDNVHIEHHVCLGQRTNKDVSAPVIRKNCVIGTYTVILGGCEIGEGSVIGAGSIILDDVPPNSIAYNPREVCIKKNNKKLGQY